MCRDDWSLQLYTQLKQLWNVSLETIQAWTAFEHLRDVSDTDTVLYQANYRCWPRCDFLIIPVVVKKNCMHESFIFKCRAEVGLDNNLKTFKFVPHRIWEYSPERGWTRDCSPAVCPFPPCQWGPVRLLRTWTAQRRPLSFSLTDRTGSRDPLMTEYHINQT